MIGFLDVSAGVSGDMLLGALVDAGVGVDVLGEAVGTLDLGITLEASEVVRGGLRATKVDVHVPDRPQPHRTLADVDVALAPLSQPLRDVAEAVFGRLAAAEAAVHGVAPTEVHFHEVGALDAIADVVGAVAGFAALDLDELHVGPIGVGAGRAGATHGSLPVPVPAVVELTRGFPVVAGPAPFESATPTGVAVLAELVTHRTGLPAMTLARAGIGAGGRDPGSHPNIARLLLGTPVAAVGGPATTTSMRDGDAGERWIQVEANVDDSDPRLWSEVIAALLDAGAADAWCTPIVMKKGRPALTVHALTEAIHLEDVQRVLFATSTTIGCRTVEVGKVASERSSATVTVDGHPIGVKIASWDGSEVNRSVEWDDVVAAARALGRPAKAVLAQATRAAQDTQDLRSGGG